MAAAGRFLFWHKYKYQNPVNLLYWSDFLSAFCFSKKRGMLFPDYETFFNFSSSAEPGPAPVSSQQIHLSLQNSLCNVEKFRHL